MEHIGGIFYINLDKRTDRRTEIEAELERMGISGERFPAIVDTPGAVGCMKSHIAVLKEARRRNLKNVLILEDDFEFLLSKEILWERINEFFDWHKTFGILMFEYDFHELIPFNNLISKVLYACHTGAYIVDSGCYDPLINLWEENLPNLISTGDHKYHLDHIWNTLAPEYHRYAFRERVGKQRNGFSDIVNGYIRHI